MTFTNCKKGRVIAVFRELFLVELNSTNELLKTKLSGKFIYESSQTAVFPTVGDYVLLDQADRIFEIEKRKTVLERSGSGNNQKQVLCANVDVVFITSSLNANLNFNRIERFLVMIKKGGAKPILLFTKRDLLEEDELVLIKNEIELRFPSLPKVFVSKNDTLEPEEFLNLSGESSVWVLVGSSGVGKSTFINLLLGSEHILTREIRECDDKGRHTTTHRQMYKTPLGIWIIDSPGIRELDIEADDDVLDNFKDIETLASLCRFSDCLHDTEPGCAVKRALSSGELDTDRFQSYQKFYSRKSYDLRKMSPGEKVDLRERWKRQSLRCRKDEKLTRNLLNGR